MNRGSENQVASNTRIDTGFNEAPIHESGKFEVRNRLADWLGASMRPRFMNRGSQNRGKSARTSHVASMRPRFMNRGST